MEYALFAANLSDRSPGFTDSGVATSGTSSTPRAQFWTDANYKGDKLDKDVKEIEPRPSSTALPDLYQPASQGNLSKTCRNSLAACLTNWDNSITSLQTTGGGQWPASVVVYDTAGPGEGDGPTSSSPPCLSVPAGRAIPNLGYIVVITPGGAAEWQDWSDRISDLSIFMLDVAPDYCATFWQNLPTY
jgi:hypothetical protein